MLLGCAIGDALGMPVETFKPEDIAKRYPESGGRVTTYLEPHGHKWFDGTKQGTTTDDWQLTAATIRGLISGDLSMDEQVKANIVAMERSTKGWGGTTRGAVRKAANGVSWVESGEWENGKGRGNGVVMKISPLAVLYFQRMGSPIELDNLLKFVGHFTIFTHRTRMALVASYAHLCGLVTALSAPHMSMESYRDMCAFFISAQLNQQIVERNFPDYDKLPAEEHLIEDRMRSLRNYRSFDYSKPTELFGGGTCYVYDSLPFTYAWFLKDPDSIETLYDCISAGGDADSNGSMVGALLGARNGAGIFPQHLVDGLQSKDEVLELAEAFCDRYSIK